MAVDIGLPWWLAICAASGAVTVLAGTILARTGDAIASRTHLGGLFVGMLLLAGATSLPEIVTAVAATIDGAPDLAVSEVLGSSMANMAILAVIDLVARRRVWPSIELGHARVGALAIALTAIIVLAIVSPTGLRIGWVGIEPLVVAVVYVLASLWIGRADRVSRRAAVPGPARDVGEELLQPTGWGSAHGGSLRRDAGAFAAAALLIVVAGPVLAVSAQAIADETGIGETFIGITLLAAATSLPELVAALAAVRIGAFDLAVGNLFGSNAFNMTVVLWADVAHTEGPVLDTVSMAQVVPGLGAILLMALAISAILGGDTTRLRRGEPDAVLLLVAYIGLLLLAWAGSV